MGTYQTNAFLDDFVFLEGPRWRDGELWISDMWDHTVYRIAPDGRKQSVVKVENRPSGLGFMPDGALLIVSMADRKLLKFSNNELSVHADLSSLVNADINDMVVDDSGRAYIGNFGYDLFADAEPQTAELVAVEPDGSSRVVADGLNFPNGMVIKNSGKELVVAETFGHKLSIFDITSNGDLENHRPFADLGDMTPDGICLDNAEHIWVASYMTNEFVRLDPNGQIVDKISVGGAAVACQLGGDDGTTLYCLVYDGQIEDIASGKRGARIETTQVEHGAGGSP